MKKEEYNKHLSELHWRQWCSTSSWTCRAKTQQIEVGHYEIGWTMLIFPKKQSKRLKRVEMVWTEYFRLASKWSERTDPLLFYELPVNFCNIIFVLSYLTKSVKFVCFMYFAPLALCFMHFTALCNLSAILVSFFC